ncbi:hypothetical protein pipiens_009429 [Culex pipiens pipiens]|uniref:Uncharacterized protein n=1 Tax=Culex pipiens pipiens TaxID=38569 RepID=A0ABD1DEZ0_CULPP
MGQCCRYDEVEFGEGRDNRKAIKVEENKRDFFANGRRALLEVVEVKPAATFIYVAVPKQKSKSSWSTS